MPSFRSQRVYFNAPSHNNDNLPRAMGTLDGFRLPNGDFVRGFHGDYYASETIAVAPGYDVRGKTFAEIKEDNDDSRYAPLVCVVCGKARATTILEFEMPDGWTGPASGTSNGPFYLCSRDATASAERVLSRGGSPRLGNV